MRTMQEVGLYSASIDINSFSSISYILNTSVVTSQETLLF
jgi:hypothetical protein